MDLSLTVGSNKVRKGSVCSRLTLIKGNKMWKHTKMQWEPTNWTEHKELKTRENEPTKQSETAGLNNGNPETKGNRNT